MPRFLHYSDIENVYDDPERVGRLAGLIQQLDGEDALVTGTGDNTSPGVLAMVERGRQALPFFVAIGADLETFGNHDFDYGPDATRELVADSPQTWVSANVRDENGDLFGAAEGVTPWTIEEVDGARIGLVGVTDPATDSINPRAADLGFTDPVETVSAAVADLRNEGVDYVVVLSHLGGGDDDLARELDVDVVLGGHVHTERTEIVNGTLLTRPGANGHCVLEVTLGEDADADHEDGDVQASVERHDPSDAPMDADLAADLRGRMASAGLNDVVADVDDPILRDEESIYGGESRIGNLVADAYRWETDADVGLQNSGGIRNGPPLSDGVTVADLVSVLPFEEPIVVVELTGEELLEVFRQASAAVVDFGEPHWWHGHVSGAELVWDEERNELRDARVGGKPVMPDELYTVATPEYLLHSDHEFPSIAERHRAGEHRIQHEVLADYAREEGLDAAVEGRIRRVNRSATPDPE